MQPDKPDSLLRILQGANTPVNHRFITGKPVFQHDARYPLPGKSPGNISALQIRRLDPISSAGTDDDRRPVPLRDRSVALRTHPVTLRTRRALLRKENRDRRPADLI